MSHRNKLGPSTALCGTPDPTLAVFKKLPSTTTFRNRVVREFRIQSSVDPLIP